MRILSRRRCSVSLASRFPPLEPKAKRFLCLTGSATRQETRHADIFIQLRPMDTFASRDQTPVGALRWCSVRQAREPGKRHRDRPAIREVRNQSVVANAYTLSKCFLDFSSRSIHARTSTKSPRFPRPIFGSVQFPRGQNHGFPPSGPVPAKLCHSLVTLDVHVGRFIAIRRVKEESIWPRPTNGWQRFQCTRPQD